MANNGKRRTPLVADKRYAKPQKTTKKATGGKQRPPRRPRRGKRAAPRRRLPLILALPLGLIRWVLRIFLRLGMVTAVVAAIGIAAAVFYTASTIPPMSKLVDGRAKGSVTMLDRYGDTYAWRGNQFAGIVTADTVSDHLKNAVVATEDRRFYRHFGVSPRGIASAIRINLAEGRGPLSGHGGSTITQQTAKLLCLGNPYDPNSGMTEAEYEADCRRSSLARKAKEAIYALALETKLSKDEILTIYLNRAYFGGGSYGAEAASQRYYGKSAANISPGEAATLAGLLTAPSTYAPTANMDRSWSRALTVIKLMEQQGYLTAAEAQAARANPAQLSEAAQREAGGYFADWVMGEGPSFLTRDTTEDVIIRTTFDPAIQAAAEEALLKVFEEKVADDSEAQAAIVVMSADGAVRAMVGGRQTKVSGAFNRATQAMRQTGSAFKPFVYAAALDLGWSYDDTIVDEPITIDVPGSGPWSPQNYTRKFYGPVTLTTALKNSLNIPAIKLSEDVGRENVRTVASYFGIESDLAAGPALALGVSETTLLQMTGAFAGIQNGGSAVEPYGLVELSLLGDEQPLMEQEGGIGKRVIQENANRQLVYMMHQVIESGSGQRARLEGREAAGKTGTTQSARDAWFVGFTADYVAGVWMGYDDNTPLTGVTGGGLPAEIWRETMTRVHADLEPRPLPMIRPEREPVVAQDAQPEPFDPANIFNGGNRRPREDSLIGVIQNILGIN
ncbi:MAG: transglycosylase domain-containing protein [Maritimibacter harenae]|jgi:1A family penicillin-binding protein|uniref:peptidoglycan glycosyltransferase n=1 Tax=Maritimibacter harenae TaxID=2606218 RepID=A0A845M1P4_9RHOB|nr:PBP1A family penicillin-binding protein [Maritimibacter harenae]MZR12268.1 PBP1A family penicillin-binding protein [Maritimibacter harenae]